jgi:hypothetical protein
MGNYKRSQGSISPLSQPVVAYETVVPNPKLKLLDQVREVMRLKHYSIRAGLNIERRTSNIEH